VIKKLAIIQVCASYIIACPATTKQKALLCFDRKKKGINQ